MKRENQIEIKDNKELSTVQHVSKSEKWVFLCHGFGGNKEGNIKQRAQRLQEDGWNAVRFDFRGNGESDGSFIDQNLSTRIEDLETVVNHYGPENCVVFGSSFGGKVVFHFAAQDGRVDAVIGKAPVTYNSIMSKFKSVVEKKGRYEYIEGKPIDERFFEDFDKYSFSDVVNNLDVPVAIFHGSEDTTVHTENSFNAAQELNTDVSLQKLKGEKHSFSKNMESFMREEIVSWLDNIEL